jgi:hypothetical protein
MGEIGVRRAGWSIDFEQISERVPRALVERILKETKKESVRERKLPAYLMVYYVITVGLMASESAREVLRQLMRDVQDQLPKAKAVIASRAAICQARKRLGAEPIRRLFEAVAKPMAKQTTQGAWFRRLRLVAIDGSSLQLQDTPANRDRYGQAHAVKSKKGPFPLLRFVALCEIGTHALFAVRMSAWNIGEVTLAKQLVDRLEAGMLCLADRLFYGFELWNQAVATGAQLMWRVQKGVRLPCLKRLSDGSYLSEVRANTKAKAVARQRRIPVRVIEFHVSVGGLRKDYRVITTLLDPRKAPALELANLYAKRWGIETAFAELKTYLRGHGVLLRSRQPDLVEQDFYGLLLAHFGVRSIMHEAASKQKISPAELSFVHAVRVIIRRLPEMVSFSPLWWLPVDPSPASG